MKKPKRPNSVYSLRSAPALCKAGLCSLDHTMQAGAPRWPEKAKLRLFPLGRSLSPGSQMPARNPAEKTKPSSRGLQIAWGWAEGVDGVPPTGHGHREHLGLSPGGGSRGAHVDRRGHRAEWELGPQLANNELLLLLINSAYLASGTVPSILHT